MADMLDRPGTAAPSETPLASDTRANADAAPDARPSHSRVAARLLTRGLRVGALPVLSVILFVVVVLGTAIGAVPIAPQHSAAILLNATHITHFARHWPETDETILLIFRMPRVAGALLVGAALGVSGTLFQGLLRNPLADPLLLGTSAGAALGATIAFTVPAFATSALLGFGWLPVLAFVGALGAVALVYRLASNGGRTPVVTLLLAGVAVGAVLTAAETLIITLSDHLGLRVTALYLWISGGVVQLEWAQVQIIAAIIAVGIVGALLLAPTLDAFALGEEMVAHLGLHVERSKLLIVGVASLLVAAAVSISGLVGFVGLIAPHLCRIVLGPRHRLLIPASALAGAIFVVLADLLARTVAAPTELPLGVVTALLGGPFFLSLLRKAGQHYQW